MKRWQGRLLGLAGVLGGAVGLYLVFGALVAAPLSVPRVVALAPFALLYGGALWGGMLAFENAPHALGVNRWIWFAQIPVVNSAWLSYLFVSGAEFIVRVRPQPLRFETSWLLGSRFDLAWNTPRTLEIGINLVALGVFLWLGRLRRGKR